MRKFNFYVYASGSNNLSLSIDDPVMIEKILDAAKSEAKSAAWREDIEACREYCDLYLDIKQAYEEMEERKNDTAGEEETEEKTEYTFYSEDEGKEDNDSL